MGPSRRLITATAAAALLAATASAGALAQSDMADIDAWLADVKAAHEGKTINMLMASHPSTSSYVELIKPFEEATGVTVNLDPLEEGAMLEKQILECQRSSPDFDIWMVPVESGTFFAETGCINQLDEQIAATPDFYGFDDLVPAYVDLFTIDGGQYAIPFAGETVFLMYRKDLFDEKGLEPPTTWDELLEIAQQFKEEGQVDGVSFRARRGWEFTYTYSIFLFPFGGQMFVAGTATPDIDTQGSRDALDFMIALKDAAPLGVESFSFPEAWQAFQNGTAAMAVEASAAAPEMEDPEKSIVAGNVGYAPLPEGPAGAFSGVWGWGLGVNGASENPDLAWDVIAWLTGQQNQDAYLDEGGIPSRISAYADPELAERFPFFPATLAALDQAAALAEQGQSVVAKIPEWNEVSNVIGDLGSQAFSGQISSDEAVTRMQTDIDEIMSASE